MGNLTKADVKNAKPGDKLADGDGLRLDVDKSGNASWIFRFRSPATGKERFMGLGPLRDIDLQKAREAGRYRTQRGAALVMERVHKGGLLGQLRSVARRRRWQRINPSFAQVGDVGLIWIEQSGRKVMATVVCRKYGWFVGRNANGITFMPASRVAAAWSVLPDVLQPTGTRHAIAPRGCKLVSSAEMVARDPISIFVLSAIGIEAVAGSIAVTVTTFLITTSASCGVSASRRMSA